MAKIDSFRQPTLFSLEDLLGDQKKGLYYQQQLKLAPDPKDSNYWEVEKIIKTRKIKGKTQHLVKFLYYPGFYPFSISILKDSIKTLDSQ